MIDKSQYVPTTFEELEQKVKGTKYQHLVVHAFQDELTGAPYVHIDIARELNLVKAYPGGVPDLNALIGTNNNLYPMGSIPNLDINKGPNILNENR